MFCEFCIKESPPKPNLPPNRTENKKHRRIINSFTNHRAVVRYLPMDRTAGWLRCHGLHDGCVDTKRKIARVVAPGGEWVCGLGWSYHAYRRFRATHPCVFLAPRNKCQILTVT